MSEGQSGGYKDIRIILFGPPGAGKGTQGERIAAITGATHLASGDLVRAAIAANTPLGQEVKSYNDRGLLVPDEIIVQIVGAQLETLPCWILDGFPRTVPQAVALDDFLKAHGEDIEAVIDLDVPDDALVARLSARRESATTKAIYNLLYEPPPPTDPGPFIQRSDDQPDVIAQRLKVYHAKTEPLIQYYRDKGLLVRIDASGPPQRVLEDIMRAISPD